MNTATIEVPEVITPEIVAPEQQKELLAVVQQNGLQPETAQSLQTSFAPFFANAKKVLEQSRAITVTDASQKLQIKLARECRLALRAIRVDADKARKSLKEESLRRGKAIDGFYNILLHLTEQEENRLEEQEKFVERQEAQRKAELKAKREEELKAFGVDTTFFQLGDMPEESYQQFLENSRAAHVAKIEAARKAEEERIRLENERLKEEARIRAENERLKREAEEREKVARAEREKAEAERRRLEEEKLAVEEKARKEREAIEAENARRLAEERRKAEEAAAVERKRVEAERKATEEKARREREELERKAKTEREAREKAEAEARAVRETEQRRVAAEAEARRRAAAAPDKEKLAAFAAKIRALDVPELSTAGALPLVAEIESQREKFAQWIEKRAASL